MSVILLILKIIGCILLFLFGLVLLILACVFFVPVRYRLFGSFFGEPVLHIRVTWLIGLVCYSYVQEAGESAGELRICGIRLGKKDGRDGAESEDSEEEEAPCEAEEEPSEEDAAGAERRSDDDSHGDKREQGDIGSRGAKRALEDTGLPGDQKAKADDDSGSGRKVKEGTHSESVGKAEKDTRSESDEDAGEPGKAARLKEAFYKAKSIITDESNKIVVGSVWSELWYLLRHFRFRYIRAEVRFSLADPAATGQALGVLCMMPFLYGRDVEITPDFEADRMYVEGEAEALGRMRCVHFLASLLRLIRQKEVRSLIKRLRNK